VWSSRTELKQALRQADVAIGALRPEHGRTPMVVPKDVVGHEERQRDRGCQYRSRRLLRDQRGHHPHRPGFKKYGVVHYCVPNIASRVPRTASYALTNIFGPCCLHMGDVGGFEDLIKRNLGLRHGVYCYNGALTSEVLSEAFRLPFKGPGHYAGCVLNFTTEARRHGEELGLIGISRES
jgi:alanine dehydrogenase